MADDIKKSERTEKGDDLAASEQAQPETAGSEAVTNSSAADKGAEAGKGAEADKTPKTVAGASAGEGSPAPKRTFSLPHVIAAAMVALVVGLTAGSFAGRLSLGGEGTISLAGKTTLGETELDSTIATFTYDGTTHAVTAREVIEMSSSLESAANDDGTYNVPNASDVIYYAQSEVILLDAEKRGLSVTDDEVAAYAEKYYGSSDYASIASDYGIDEETAKSVITDSALRVKLRDEVVTTAMPELPAEPTEPAEGSEDTPTADYAAYVIGLLGDEWDSEANTWATTDGDYYATLSSYEISNDSATYAAAEAAYSVAYSKYYTAYTEVSSEWTSYVNTLLSNTSMQLGSLVSQ